MQAPGHRFFVAVALATAMLLCAPRLHAQGHCGPIIVAGHDADDHGFEAVYAGLFDELQRNLNNAGSGILAIGADPGSQAAIWIQNVASLMATPQLVTLVNDAAIATVDFMPFAILHVPSDDLDTFGGITQAEADLLTARANDIGVFQAAGGALFGLTQGELTNGWSWIGGVGAFTHLDVPPSGTLPSGDLFDNVTSTAEGRRLGIDDLNLDGCCFHNVFTAYPSWLRILAQAEEPLDPAYHEQAVFIGGVNRCVVLAVTWREVVARTAGTGVEISWTTLVETDTLGFEVRRVSADGSIEERVGDPLESRGPLWSYRVFDPSPSSAAPFYYVREISTRGDGSVSERVAVTAAGAAGARRRGTLRR